MTRTARTIALLGLTGALLAGCAEPGQLGSPAPAPVVAAQPTTAPPTTAPPTTAPPSGPVLLGSGLIKDRVSIRTPGPTEFFVSRVILAPGATTGWHRHSGTEMSVVSSGSITLLRENDCEGARHPAGDAVFIPDSQSHLARNDGTVSAELIVTYLLAPGAEDREVVPDPC